MEQSLITLQVIESETRQKALPLLVMLKQLEDAGIADINERAKVIKPTTNVMETDNDASRVMLVARINEEYVILDRRDQWYHVRLAGGRDGWIHEDDIQVVSTPSVSQPGKSGALSQREMNDILILAEMWVTDISAKYDATQQVFLPLEKSFQSASETEQQELLPLYQEIVTTRDKIFRYHAYTNYFYRKYADVEPVTGIPESSILKGIAGLLSIQLGRSSYQTRTGEALDATDEVSETSRDISLSAWKTINERSRVSASMYSKREVIQTPYGSSNIRLGYDHRFEEGFNLNTYAGFNGYEDLSVGRNTFKQLGLGYNLNYRLSQASQLFSDFDFLNKDFKVKDGNNYSSSRFNAGWRYKKSHNEQLTVVLHGMIQSSDASYLDFKQFNPQVNYQRQLPREQFNAKLEMETIGYDKDAKGNNYSRERLDLVWTRSNRMRRVSMTAKQFPNNEDLGYVKLGGQMQWQNGGLARYARSNLSILMVYFPQGDGQVNYLDFRADRSTSGKKYYLDFNIFSRLWSKTDDQFRRDHVVDLYGLWGWKFSRVRVGPLVGAHLLMHKDEKLFERDGNSIRLGADFNGNFVFGKSTLNLSLRYEKNYLFGNEIAINTNTGETTVGDVVTRKPTTMQFYSEFRTPVGSALDLRFVLHRYKVKLDVDEETSIDPLLSRDRFVFTAGLAYRFGE